MNILAAIKPAFTVLTHGSSLSKPGFWAHIGGLTVFLLALRDIAKAVFPDAALISDDVVAHIAGAIGGLFGAYLMLASNKDAGVKLPPIELQAEPEPTITHDIPEFEVRRVPEYQHHDGARWVYQPKVPTESSPTPESETVGFGDKN